MKIPRQHERRARFATIFPTMPLWETWTTEFKADTGFRDVNGERILVDVKRNHCKPIPRRVRRDMARKRSLREYRRDHDLPEATNE